MRDIITFRSLKGSFTSLSFSIPGRKQMFTNNQFSSQSLFIVDIFFAWAVDLRESSDIPIVSEYSKVNI